MNKFIKKIRNILVFLIIFILCDVILMFFLPNEIKNKIYDRKSHKIKSYYYHHDLRPNAFWIENWGYQNSKIFTNNLGFKDKNNRIVKFKKNNILFIGDSFTEGVGVEYQNTFVGEIENKVVSISNEYEILNAGVVSYSPIVILSKLNYLVNIKKLPITKVFVVLCNGDIHDDLYRYKDINEKFVVSHGDFLNVKILVEINNFLKAHTILYQFIKRITPLSNLFKDIKNENNNDFDNYDLEKVLSILNNKPDQKHIVDKKEFDKWGKSGLDKSKVHLQKIKKLLDENKIGLTLVYLEEPIFMLNSINSSTYYNFWNKFSQENKIDFIFVNEYHKDKKDKFEIYKKFFFIGDNHFNDKGNKAVAEEIFRKSKYFQKIIKLNQ